MSQIHKALTGHHAAEGKRRRKVEIPVGDRLLLTAAEAAAALGVSLRTFYGLRAALPTVTLGPRVVRYRAADLETYVAAAAVVGRQFEEPQQLAAGKTARRGIGGDIGSPATETQQRRGSQRKAVPSNAESTASEVAQ